jgi:hypothetical protein
MCRSARGLRCQASLHLLAIAAFLMGEGSALGACLAPVGDVADAPVLPGVGLVLLALGFVAAGRRALHLRSPDSQLSGG